MSRRKSLGASSADDDDGQPYLAMAQENESKQRKNKALVQQKLAVKSTKPPSDDSDSDDDDDDGLKLKSYNFGQHKASAAKQPRFSMTSAFDDVEGKKKPVASKADRMLIRDKWPRGKPPLPKGWEARFYKAASGGAEYWIFRHPIHGETRTRAHLDRTDEEWAEAKRGGGKKRESEGSERRASNGGGFDDDDAFEEGGGAAADGDDMLASLLAKRQRKEAEDEQMRSEVQEEMALRMDTGVRVNPALQKMWG